MSDLSREHLPTDWQNGLSQRQINYVIHGLVTDTALYGRLPPIGSLDELKTHFMVSNAFQQARFTQVRETNIHVQNFPPFSDQEQQWATALATLDMQTILSDPDYRNIQVLKLPLTIRHTLMFLGYSDQAVVSQSLLDEMVTKVSNQIMLVPDTVQERGGGVEGCLARQNAVSWTNGEIVQEPYGVIAAIVDKHGLGDSDPVKIASIAYLQAARDIVSQL